MDPKIPTMEHRFFTPSEQLTGTQGSARGSGSVNQNYRGDPSLAVNRGEGVPAEKNTCLWITGLPAKITIPELLAAIGKPGKVRSTVINGPAGDIASSAASISFFRRSDAENLLNAFQQGRIILGGKFPRVQWNRNRVRDDEGVHSESSRVLMIAGDPEVVNREYLDGFFTKKFVYEIDQIVDHGEVEGDDGPIHRMEYRFGSWRAQAEFARKALTLELKGFLLAEYGPDPCAP
ncbi:hypothetical protein M426DRAFT_14713 [Hypoxylon sp. CI-4A]|nr:hypothetical protein M426DRAFT_14713 [Hypoxylon sp. CI-4A]